MLLSYQCHEENSILSLFWCSIFQTNWDKTQYWKSALCDDTKFKRYPFWFGDQDSVVEGPTKHQRKWEAKLLFFFLTAGCKQRAKSAISRRSVFTCPSVDKKVKILWLKCMLYQTFRSSSPLMCFQGSFCLCFRSRSPKWLTTSWIWAKDSSLHEWLGTTSNSTEHSNKNIIPPSTTGFSKPLLTLKCVVFCYLILYSFTIHHQLTFALSRGILWIFFLACSCT